LDENIITVVSLAARLAKGEPVNVAILLNAAVPTDVMEELFVKGRPVI
jgi:hypothetical protein